MAQQEGHDEASVPTILVVGSVNIDLVTYTPRVPQGGETLTASCFETRLGGKGANQAVACAKLSRAKSSIANGTANVRMIAAVGSDSSGKDAKQALQELAIDTTEIKVREKMKTGIAVIIVDEASGENRILLSAEANKSLAPTEFLSIPTPRPALIILQLEIPLDTVIHIVHLARRQGIPVLLNAAPAQQIPAPCFPGISHLVVNETEAVLLSELPESHLCTEDGLAIVARHFHNLGVNTVVITLGGRGVYYSADRGCNHGLVAAEKVSVVDTTAAGDTFIGAYSLEIVKENADIQKAVQFANRAAAKTVARRGAQESIPWLDEFI